MSLIQRHLDHDEVLIALTDHTALESAAREHLAACQECRMKVAAFEQRLKQLGQTARLAAPQPSRPFRLPAPAARHTARYRLKPFWATGLTAALLLAVALWGLLPQATHNTLPHLLTAREITADRALFEEVNNLVENALPAPYRELAALYEGTPAWDEDLIDWIVPSI